MKNHRLVNSSIQLNGLCLDSFEITNTFEAVYFCSKNSNQKEKFVETCFIKITPARDLMSQTAAKIIRDLTLQKKDINDENSDRKLQQRLTD